MNEPQDECGEQMRKVRRKEGDEAAIRQPDQMIDFGSAALEMNRRLWNMHSSNWQAMLQRDRSNRTHCINLTNTASSLSPLPAISSKCSSTLKIALCHHPRLATSSL